MVHFLIVFDLVTSLFLGLACMSIHIHSKSLPPTWWDSAHQAMARQRADRDEIHHAALDLSSVAELRRRCGRLDRDHRPIPGPLRAAYRTAGQRADVVALGPRPCWLRRHSWVVASDPFR